jgi:hypothetical protein
MPMVAANKEGIVGISWYAGKASRHFTAAPVDPRLALHAWYLKGLDVRCDVDERFTASLDGGKTVLPSVVVNPVPDPKPIKFVPSVVFDDRFNPAEVSGGFRVSIEYSTTGNGDTQGLAVAPDGSFYPAWVDFRTGVGMIRTARIDVLPTTAPDKSSAPVTAECDPCQPPNEPDMPFTTVPVPKSLPANDATAAFQVKMLRSSRDEEHNVYTIDIQLEGPAGQLARGDYLQLIYGQWPADAAFLNADNGLRGAGARWLFKAEDGPGAATNVRAKSAVRHIRLYVPPLQLHWDNVNFYLRVIKPDS